MSEFKSSALKNIAAFRAATFTSTIRTAIRSSLSICRVPAIPMRLATKGARGDAPSLISPNRISHKSHLA
jgi:hypothetical protein